ncbi:hypothetical protein EV426DRAFT_587738 [Tirmania nivea]|nr:hypothetical protein EV426DRAFT_587738 [Tirmania nivea]
MHVRSQNSTALARLSFTKNYANELQSACYMFLRFLRSFQPHPTPAQPDVVRMCQATVCYCMDCKQEYWAINESACWRARVSDMNEVICWNITFPEILELKEWMDCAKCRGDSEDRHLKFTKPPGLRLNVHRVHSKAGSLEPFQRSDLVLKYWEAQDPPSKLGKVTVNQFLKYGGQKEEREAAGQKLLGKGQRSDTKPGLLKYPSRWLTSMGILRAKTTSPIKPERRSTMRGISWSSLWSSLKVMSW